MLKDLLTIFRRELGAYFNSLIAYIFLIVFGFVTCGVYMLSFFLVGRAEMRSFFGILPVMLVVFVPAVTMRLWAEDRRGGTIELLLTFPMKTASVVLGKYLASLLFFLAALATTLPIPIMLSLLGNPDWGPIWGGYFGSVLAGAFFLSVGLFVSGLARDQIVAFVVAMVACFAFYLLGMPFVAAQVDAWSGPLELGSRVLSFVAMTKHFEGAERGLLDIRDMIYFATMTALFLGLNTVFLDIRMCPRAKVRFIGSAAVLAALAVFVNVVALGFTAGRFDLTEEKIYTVSKEAKQVMGRLRVPVRVDYYVSPSEKMPSIMKTFEQEVTDKLREFEIASGGNLKFKVHHVEAVDALRVEERQIRKQIESQVGEDQANAILGEEKEEEESKGEELAEKLMEKGIQPFRLQSIEADERTTVSVYSGIAIAYKEKKEEVIPRIVPQNLGNLEYELVSRVFRLTEDKKPKVAVVAPMDEMDPQTRRMLQMMNRPVPEAKDNFDLLGQFLQHDGYQPERIDFAEYQSIPDDVDTVVVVNPRRFEDRQRWEINRMLRAGKSVVLAVQNYVLSYTPGARGVGVRGQDVNPGVNEILEEYGLRIPDEFLMDEQSEILSIGSGRGPFMMSTDVKLPVHVVLTERSANPDVSISNRLSSIFYLWGVPLELDEDTLKENDLSWTVLFSSGPKSWTRPLKAGEMDGDDFARPAKYEGGEPLAVLIEGQFPSAFEENAERPEWPRPPQFDPNQPPPEPPPDPPQDELPPAPGKLLVYGCALMWSNDFLRSGGNLPLFQNSIDALSLGDELIHIRTKTKRDRLIEKVSAGRKHLFRLLVMGLFPLLIAVAGGLRFWQRRRIKETYLREVPGT